MSYHDIKISNLSIKFKGASKSVVDDCSILFKQKEVTGIVGESGSGKSLLAMSILQLLPQTAIISGCCKYKNHNLYVIGARQLNQIRGKEIALIPQNAFHALNPTLKIGRQLMEPLLYHTDLRGETAKNHILETLKVFGFNQPQRIINAYPFELSGGMNQRVVTVMGLLSQPKWVIADEPTKGLDAILRKSVYKRLRFVGDNLTESIILITHDLLFAKKLCDTIGVMKAGKLIEFGKADQVIDHPQQEYTKLLVNAIPGRRTICPIRSV